MDEKLQEKLLEIYDSLTDEQKEKVKECKTMEEVSAFAAEEGIELPDEMLDEVAGGYIFYNADRVNRRWDVINDSNGNVIASVFHEQDAKNLASANGHSQKELSWDELSRLRSTGSIKKKGC